MRSSRGPRLEPRPTRAGEGRGERDDVDREKYRGRDPRDGRRRPAGERRERRERERHLGDAEVASTLALPDRMYVLVRDPRRHREVAQRGRDETDGIERPEPCSRESRRKREPAIELEIEHPTETCWPAPAPTRQRSVDPISQRRS